LDISLDTDQPKLMPNLSRGPRDLKNCPGSNSTLEMAGKSKNPPPKKVLPAVQTI
jgi:hypothetical protein